MSRKHRLKKVFAGHRKAPVNSRMRYIDGQFTCTATADGWTHGETIRDARTAKAIALQVMPVGTDGKLAADVRTGVEANYSGGRLHYAIRLKTADNPDRATKSARSWKDWLTRVFPKLRIRELDSAPERIGKIRLSKRFYPDCPVWQAKPYVEFTRAAGKGSAWYSITGPVTEKVLDALRVALESGIVVEICQTRTSESTGTNAYMPLDHATRAKRRMELKRGLAAAQDRAGVNDTLTHPAPGKEVIYVRKHGRKMLASELPGMRAAMADVVRNERLAGDKTRWMTSDIHERIPANSRERGALAGTLPTRPTTTIFTNGK